MFKSHAFLLLLLLVSCSLHSYGAMSQEVPDGGDDDGDDVEVDDGADDDTEGGADDDAEGGADDDAEGGDDDDAEGGDDDDDTDGDQDDAPAALAEAVAERCPLVKSCAKDCSRLKDARGCFRCYCYRDCRRRGCPRGFICRRASVWQLPAYTCVRRLRCPNIVRPLVPARNVCLKCETNCNCLKCRHGHLCCRDWYGCVKCVRGIPYSFPQSVAERF